MRRLIDVGLALGYAGLIFFLSAQSSFPVPQEIWSFDKGIHCVEYGVLGFLVARAVRGRPGSGSIRPHSDQRTVLIAVILSSLYGASDEFHQSFVPRRSAEALDVAADTVGSLMGALVFALHSHRSRRGKRGA